MNYIRFQIYTILLLYYDPIFYVPLTVIVEKIAGAAASFALPPRVLPKEVSSYSYIPEVSYLAKG